MTLIVIAVLALIAVLVACGAPLLLTLAIFALIALALFGFMLIKGFPRQLTTVEALRDGPYEARREELLRKSAQSRARLAAVLASKHSSKKRGIKGW